MKTAELEDVLYWESRLYKVVGISTGKTLTLEPLEDNDFCINCKAGLRNQIHIIESCPNFQEGAKAIKTIKE